MPRPVSFRSRGPFGEARFLPQAAPATGGTIHTAAVAFAAAATSSHDATVIRAASVQFAGAASSAFAASQIHTASAQFAGLGTSSFAAGLVQPVSVAFAGVGTAAFAQPTTVTGAVTHLASVAFAGVGTSAFTARQLHATSAAFAGASVWSAAANMLLVAGVAFAGAGTFSARSERPAATIEEYGLRGGRKRWRRRTELPLESPTSAPLLTLDGPAVLMTRSGMPLVTL